MKYLGSKSRISKYIVPIMQNIIDENKLIHFVDLFCGGCNVIDKIKCENRIANDINPFLISLFRHLREGYDLPEHMNREIYDDAKKSIGLYPEWYIGAVGFLASYNGKFFDGGYARPGYENGRLRDYYREASDNIRNQMPQLRNVRFQCTSYDQVYPYTSSLTYCDIPYKNTTSYGYSNKFNYDNFYDWCRKYAKETHLIISEQEMPDDFIPIWEGTASRSLNPTNKTVGIEKLFIHKDGLIKCQK